MLRKNIGNTLFKVESKALSTRQKLEIRKLIQVSKISTIQPDDFVQAKEFIEEAIKLSEIVGGEPPKPALTDTKILEEIQAKSGNEQLNLIFDKLDELKNLIIDLKEQQKILETRWPNWLILNRLVKHASAIEESSSYKEQMEIIEKERQLLVTPDPIEPLISGLSQLLRDELNKIQENYKRSYSQGMNQLKSDKNWQRLKESQKTKLISECKLEKDSFPKIVLGSVEDILKTLDNCPVSQYSDLVIAFPSKIDHVLVEATKLLTPEVKPIKINRSTLTSTEEIDIWIDETKKTLTKAITKGPIIIQ